LFLGIAAQIIQILLIIMVFLKENGDFLRKVKLNCVFPYRKRTLFARAKETFCSQSQIIYIVRFLKEGHFLRAQSQIYILCVSLKKTDTFCARKVKYIYSFVCFLKENGHFLRAQRIYIVLCVYMSY